MSRFRWILIVIALMLLSVDAPAAVASADTPVAARPQRPNIVVVILDDVAAIDGRLLRAMPTVRRVFLERSVAFVDFHGETPSCCPGRAGFLTGQHTPNHGVTYNNAALLRPGMTLATQLDRLGYHTILAGKYLNQYDRIAPAVPPGWDRFHALGNADFYNYSMWSDGRRTWHGRGASDYSTDVIKRKTISSLRDAPRGRPIFAWIAPYAAHVPRTPAPRHRNDPRCSSIRRWKAPDYMEWDVSDKPAHIRRKKRRRLGGWPLVEDCRTLLSVDDLVRSTRAELRRQGRLENTLFVLTSDNGMNYGAHRVNGDKKTPYATHIPFYVSWPARLGTERRRVTERLQNIDFAPTICALVGCRMGPYPGGQRRPDGRSFASLLLGTSSSLNRDAVYINMLTRGKWLPRWHGVETTRHSPLADQGCLAAGEGGCLWSYVRYETGELELYDVSNGPCWTWRPGEPGDPCRLENLAGKRRYASIKQALRARLSRLQRS
jgi:arylsulfatase A-like enzyme